MKRAAVWWSAGILLVLGLGPAAATPAGQYRLRLTPTMLQSSSPEADFSGLVDEQLDVGDPPSSSPTSGWKINSVHNRKFPFSVTLDLGEETPLARLWVYDTHGTGDVLIEAREGDSWRDAGLYDCKRYKSWADIPLDLVTRFLRLTLRSPGAMFTEIALDAYSPTAWQARLAARAEAARKEAERAAALQRAREEALKRPLVDLEPFGTLSLVDEVDCGSEDPGHDMRADPADAVRVETILGRRCRALSPTPKECAFMTFRLGRQKLLRPHAAYVLAVDYPEDAPRSMIVINTGNETSRGFHTGSTLGDAFHPRYVNNFVESLQVPLSGRWETWTLLFRLHDRFPPSGLVRGSASPRTLSPEDGFDVTVAQFSAENIPLSRGAAVASIRLYEVLDPERLAAPLRLPPEGLPRRRLFWREEMADGVIGGKKPEDRGVDEPLEWYRHKAELMRFLGMNTYSKDLLEFGACQHWDPSPYGGNKWVYFNSDLKDLWGRIVELMGRYGFDVLPYYEYSGSKGQEGLGHQRRCKPLTRDDAYTHIKWIESANADLTDPDTLADFQKMLDLTVVNLRDKARFAGVWIRPRGQLPIGFGDATRARFAAEANEGRPVSREQLRQDAALYERYLAWWHGKRRDFLVAVRDYLRSHGISEAGVLFTGCPGEPGVGFPDWQPRFITDSPEVWRPILEREEHQPGNQRTWEILTPAEVVAQDLYLRGLLAPGLTWGGWEGHHSKPADDPSLYRSVEGVLFTHAFNRFYTVASPKTFEAFRGPSGLAIVRHYSLNEDMMFDREGQPKLGYFIADIERAGPFCMHAEAVAMANGDPTMIAYLVGSNFGRGFPAYVRAFNRAFLALPALPSSVVPGAASDPGIVVRAIPTPAHGTWFALVNPTLKPALRVKIRLPGKTKAVEDAATGSSLQVAGEAIETSFGPCELKAWHAW